MLTEILILLILAIIKIVIRLFPYALLIFLLCCIFGNKRKPQDQSKHVINNGWTWNEATQLWEPPGYKREAPASQNPRQPTYEEWKAQREKAAASKTEAAPNAAKETPKEPTQTEYQGAYKAASVLTENERIHYKTLKAAADRKGYSISIKMRLADLVTPNAAKHGREYMSHFGRIKSKHVDFVVLDENMQPKVIIELDDSSHDRKDRQERDKFVDAILQVAGYKIIHTRHIYPNILDEI